MYYVKAIQQNPHITDSLSYLLNIMWVTDLSLILFKPKTTAVDHSCGFWKAVSSKERVKPCFSCDFWFYHKSHLSWKFHWSSSRRSEDMKNFSVNINYFHQFLSICWIYWHFLVTKLMSSAYNRWCQHFSISCTLNRLFSICIKLYWY